MKIVHYRRDCIGCNVCVELAPSLWKISSVDGKADLLDSLDKNGVFVRNLDSLDLSSAELCVRDCPMRIIRVEK